MEVGVPICQCGLEEKIATSWTDKTSGMRFFCCKNYGREGHYRLFAWYDATLTPRPRVAIVGLLRKVKKMESARRIERICCLCLLIFSITMAHEVVVAAEVADFIEVVVVVEDSDFAEILEAD
ncbi:hypothetical protein GQ457_06G013490 [Hibiscus cannabinus]